MKMVFQSLVTVLAVVGYKKTEFFVRDALFFCTFASSEKHYKEL